ncbi:MAG: AAA family ATPase [Thermosipho sp. (in: Bacteria)]|nr:AAA family ATPase [Thermosipho sp. (in: thermotogales)]
MKNGSILSIHLNDYLYFKNVDIYFDEGLNVLTGETGAGKSLLLDVLGILLGITNGRIDNYSADVVINLPEDYEEFEISSGENIFSITKRNGRTTFKINGRVFPRNIISEILSDLISLHRQNSHLKFLESQFLLSVLDQIGGNDKLIVEYSGLYQEYKNLINLLEVEDLDYLKRKQEELSDYIKEIEAVDPDPLEEQELEEKYKIATNLQQNIQNFNELINISEEISSQLWSMKKIAPDKYLDQINAALDIIETMNLEFQRELSDVEEYDITEIEQKIWDYNSLKRKFGPTLEDVLQNYERYKKDLEDVNTKIELLENARERIELLQKKLEEIGEKISENRKKAATDILSNFINHANDMNLNAELDIVFTKTKMGPKGFDRVEIVGRTVKSAPLKPVRHIASGGELSRLMLSLELSIVSGGVLIFDEVDAGISGETGNKLAEKLKEVSKNYQVIVVTHLPQIAIRADRHFVVTRENDKGIVKELNESERAEEIKRMLGSRDVLSFIKESE